VISSGERTILDITKNNKDLLHLWCKWIFFSFAFQRRRRMNAENQDSKQISFCYRKDGWDLERGVGLF